MSPRYEQIESRLAAIEARLSRLEAGHLTSPAAVRLLSTESETDFPAEPASLPAFSGPSAPRLIFLFGRSIMILGGAFLLRFVTESGTVPPLPGFGLGLAYALLLIILAHRTGREHPAAAVAFGLTGMMVAFPFLYESIATLHLVNASIGGSAIVLIAGGAMFVAWHRHLRLLSWAVTLPALGLGTVLGWTTGQPVLYGWILLTLALGTVLLAMGRGWNLKQWLASGLTNLVILRLAIMAADQARGDSHGDLAAVPVVILCLGLLVSNLGLLSYGAFARAGGVNSFALLQSAAVLAVGFGGALRLTAAAGLGARPLAGIAVLIALAVYAMSFTTIRRRHGRGGAFFYFASLALALLTLGTQALVGGRLLVSAWLVLGVAIALLAGRFDRVTLRWHAVVYLILASLQAQLPRAAWDCLAAGAASAWFQPGLPGGVTLVVTALVALLLYRQSGPQETGRWRKWPRLLALALLLPGLIQLVVVGILNLAGDAPPAADPRLVAAVRTGALSLLSIGLALTARRPQLRGLHWLTYPVLALGLLKIALEDLRVGGPLELFFAFAMIGGALILAPRLSRRQEA